LCEIQNNQSFHQNPKSPAPLCKNLRNHQVSKTKTRLKKSKLKLYNYFYHSLTFWSSKIAKIWQNALDHTLAMLYPEIEIN
jgi:hypothetical protein